MNPLQIRALSLGRNAPVTVGNCLLTVAAAWLLSTSASAQNQAPPRQAPGWINEIAAHEKASKRFDQDGNGWLDVAERKQARATLADEASKRPPSSRPRPRPGGEPTGPGPQVSPADVQKYPGRPAFDPDIVRTFFLEFEDADWEKALTEFRFTDIELPAKLTVDGQMFENVGVRNRGASSFLFVSEGRKRSLNVKLDFVTKGQAFGGYRTFNLLNSNGDATMLKGFLYFHIAREYTPAPKVNFVKLVINGEYWGVYPNVQQEDKDFINDWWGTTKGNRWKAPGSPWAKAGLNYIGDNVDEYRKLYELHSKDEPEAWTALVQLCKVLTETPLDRLESELTPIFDVDAALKFLALENTFINDDGYWIRSSDYNLYRDLKGRFVIYPHDGNEAFFDLPPHMRHGAPSGTTLDPFAGADDPNKVLLSRLVAVPALRTKYLTYVRDMAAKWLDWERLGPVARKYQALIDADVKADTRKLDSYEAFQSLVEKDLVRGTNTIMSLKTFSDQRREFLLNHPEIKKLP